MQGLIIQNGCAYEEGLMEFWDPIKKYWKDKTLENGKALEGFHSPEGLKWQYTHGTGSRQKHVSPDNWEVDLRHLTRPENNDIQLAMFYDYQNNVPLYPRFGQFFTLSRQRGSWPLAFLYFLTQYPRFTGYHIITWTHRL